MYLPALPDVGFFSVFDFKKLIAIDPHVPAGLRRLELESPVLAEVVSQSLHLDQSERIAADKALSVLKPLRESLRVRRRSRDVRPDF